MIDKVETAIFEAVGYSIPLEMCREAAIAAMNALREPSATMMLAGETRLPHYLEFDGTDAAYAGDVFVAMIDAAIK